MLYQYLWFFAFTLALLPAAVLLRIIVLPVREPRPIPLEMRSSRERGGSLRWFAEVLATGGSGGQ